MHQVTKHCAILLVALLAMAGSVRADLVFDDLVVPGAEHTRLRGINGNGTIVGEFVASGLTFGFIWSEGTFLPYSHSSATLGTTIFDINNDGSFVGAYADGAGIHGFAANGPNENSLDYPAAQHTVLMAINNENTVAGFFVDPNNTARGFLVEDGNLSDPIDLPNADHTVLFGVNGPGLSGIVGGAASGSQVSGFGFDDEAFLDFSIPGSDATVILDADDSGFVGVYADGNQARGFFTKDLTDPNFIAIDVPGATHTLPWAVNESGVVVGQYTDENGQDRGFVTVVPEPGSVALIGAGVLVLMRRRGGRGRS